MVIHTAANPLEYIYKYILSSLFSGNGVVVVVLMYRHMMKETVTCQVLAIVTGIVIGIVL